MWQPLSSQYACQKVCVSMNIAMRQKPSEIRNTKQPEALVWFYPVALFGICSLTLAKQNALAASWIVAYFVILYKEK